MTTSGTVATTTFPVVKLIEHAVRRCGKEANVLTPEQLQTAKDVLFMFLAGLANRGINLWCIEKQLVALVANVANYTLADGTVDVLNANLRQSTEVTGTETVATTTHSVDFGSGTEYAVATVGLTFSAGSTNTLALQVSDDDVTYTTVRTLDAATFAADTTYWFDIDAPVSARYFRVDDVTAAPVAFTLTSLFLAQDAQEITLARMNKDDYLALPDKQATGRPLQFWFDRQMGPVLRVWPTPSSDYVDAYQFVLHRQRLVQDVGALTNTVEVPLFWSEAVVTGLAYRLALELPGVEQGRVDMLFKLSDRYLMEAETAEYDKSPVYFQPNIGIYNA